MIHTIFIIVAILYSFKIQSTLLIILSLIFLGIFIFSIKKFNRLAAFMDPPPIPAFWGIFFITLISNFLLTEKQNYL